MLSASCINPLVAPFSRMPNERRPSKLLMSLEARAELKMFNLPRALPWILASVKKTDGHDVLVMPGLLANDASTAPLRYFLCQSSYDVHGWRQRLPVKRWWTLGALASAVSSALAPRRPLNVAVTNQRVFVASTVPLADIKRITKHLVVSLNDVIMATTARALRRYLQDANELPFKSLCATVSIPVIKSIATSSQLPLGQKPTKSRAMRIALLGQGVSI